MRARACVCVKKRNIKSIVRECMCYTILRTILKCIYFNTHTRNLFLNKKNKTKNEKILNVLLSLIVLCFKMYVTRLMLEIFLFSLFI